MNKLAMTQAIMVAKETKELTWQKIGEAVGMSAEWTASACLGMNSMSAETAKKLCHVLDLGTEVELTLQKYPNKQWDQAVPTDPLLYRLYEMMSVYGPAIKEIVHEKCGDGIVSAIDFALNIEKKPDPKGERIVITLDGKFLPYKSW
ncbi:cyanase [Methylophaga nitratireducenticrescens]|uniref:Cyanate hydratase n=1 Tax=Methylophaga nitratireducenticrescens TaxID=754476 RepID=I1XLG0_METNJ|nr:cyanase [Methylophaga nitratireducenticrescens]AFI85229.1 cyanase [Methylophaga nitratireducenticrescens]AUZ85711.1 cyanase [Methylophaga nitratireducenticrescens]